MPTTTCHYLQQVFVAAVPLSSPTSASRVSCGITSWYSEFTEETWGLFPKTRASLSQTAAPGGLGCPRRHGHSAALLRVSGAALLQPAPAVRPCTHTHSSTRPPRDHGRLQRKSTHTAAPDTAGFHPPIPSTSTVLAATSASRIRRAGQAQGVCCTDNARELLI